MLSADIEEVHHFVTEIENILKETGSIQAALAKCTEAKAYIGLLRGGVVEL